MLAAAQSAPWRSQTINPRNTCALEVRFPANFFDDLTLIGRADRGDAAG